MPYIDLTLQLPTAPPPENVQRVLDEGDRRIDELFASEENRRIPRYLPSDALQLYRALADVTNRGLALGNVYCEWGSGYGVGACIAAALGYEAYGVEIEADLVEKSESLATDLGLETTILETSYVPEGYESCAGVGGTDLVRDDVFAYRSGDELPPTTYEGLGFDTSEIDVFYVYPWPTEQEFMLDLFDALAADGAILICYYGDGDICAYQRVSEEDL